MLVLMLFILNFSITRAFIPKQAGVAIGTLKLTNTRLMSSARPSLDDVERISKGMAASKRGTGSRAVPHRLNSLERSQWDVAKKRRYLVLRGTGYRKERGDSPLANIYRQFCDAMAIPTISICQGLGVGEVIEDTVLIDFSTLRTKNITDLVNVCKEETLNPTYKSIKAVKGDLDPNIFDDIDRAFEEEAIFRIPCLSMSVHFIDRAESKSFAEAIADKIGTTR
jgi:hypothetical protein